MRTWLALATWPWRTTLCLLDLCDCGGLVGYSPTGRVTAAPVHEP